MQLINNWPVSNKLALPETVRQSLITHLLAPFCDENTAAKSFWSEQPSTIIIIEKSDTDNLLSKLSETTKNQIKFAITDHEYSDELGMGYTVKLSIISDEGAGMYLVSHSSNQLIQSIGVSNV
jgi:hypothetical protein